MDFQVSWTPRARALLEEIVRRVASEDAPSAAERLGFRLIDRTIIPNRFPEAGDVFRKVNREDIRELACPPFRIIYRIDAGKHRIGVLAVWRGARGEPFLGPTELNETAAAYGAGGRLRAIAAMALNRVIGRANEIPWRLPEDFRWFKRTTMGGTLIMGRRTFESIGRPLPGRVTVVLSRSGFAHPGVRTAPSLEALAAMPLPEPRFICGGAEIYRQALPRCSELYLTLVKREIPDGDAFFPPFEEAFELVEKLRETPEFDILRYRRRTAPAAPPPA
jgi:dihydrofolate reductase